MKLILCPKCCESSLRQEGSLFRCNVCGSFFTEEEKRGIEEMIEAALASGAQADLGKLRRLLRDELEADYPDPEAVIDACDHILRVLPEDPIASIAKAFFRRDTHRGQYQRLISNFSEQLNDYQKRFLYPYVVDGCERRDESFVKTFLENQGDSALLPRLQKALKRRDEEADLYANVRRDVFVCHSHEDFPKIKPLLDRLEKEEGISCWYSERNLPINARNYKDNIRKAIANCDVFLVFASSLCMISEDVRWELDVADELGKTKRLEYRLEDRNNNIRFKHFFDGIQWIDGVAEDNFELLAERAYELLSQKAAAQEQAESPSQKPTQATQSEPAQAREPSSQPLPTPKPESASTTPADANKPILSSDGKTVLYGLYPQTVVADQTLIAELNQIPAPRMNGWYLHKGRWYAKAIANPDGNARFANGSYISKGTSYWFECEPIKWKCHLDFSTGKHRYWLLSEYLIDALRYDGGNNNYALSEIRSWLNGEFCNLAFSQGSSAIVTTNLNNSASTTSSENNRFACQNTNDKVFLLSYQEANGNFNPDGSVSEKTAFGFADPDARCAKPTDYALARGVYRNDGGNGFWWIRSPHPAGSNIVWLVNVDGYLFSSMLNGYGGDAGVRPALQIHL